MAPCGPHQLLLLAFQFALRRRGLGLDAECLRVRSNGSPHDVALGELLVLRARFEQGSIFGVETDGNVRLGHVSRRIYGVGRRVKPVNLSVEARQLLQ